MVPVTLAERQPKRPRPTLALQYPRRQIDDHARRRSLPDAALTHLSGGAINMCHVRTASAFAPDAARSAGLAWLWPCSGWSGPRAWAPPQCRPTSRIVRRRRRRSGGGATAPRRRHRRGASQQELSAPVRVIVQFEMTSALGRAHRPEAGLSTAQVNAQRQAIRQAGDGIMAQLSSTDHGNVKTYRTLPLIALEVGPEALRRLAAIRTWRVSRRTWRRARIWRRACR